MIGKLPEFNDIVASCADRQRGTVNDVVQRFTDALRGVTDPLFSKDVMYVNKSTFNVNTPSENKKWFDAECYEAKRPMTQQ